MKAFMLPVLLVSLMANAQASVAGEDEHAGHADHAPAAATAAPEPPRDHAADAIHDPASMAAAREQLLLESGGMRFGLLRADLAEARFDDGDTSWRIEGEGWYGGDRDRFALRYEAVLDEDGQLDHGRVEALYSRAFATWWNLLGGLRYDPRPEPDRGYLAFGIEGLAPYWIHLSGTGYLSDEGEVEFRFEGSTDLRFTQRLILQPRVEMQLSFSDVPERLVGKGVSNLELGLRLRYEWRREFAPYLGLEWQEHFGDTADYVDQAGEDSGALRFVAGVRFWF